MAYPGDSNGKAGVLLPQHIADLKKSGLSDETIAASRVRSLTDPEQIQRCLNWRRPLKSLAPCLAFPFPDAEGKFNGYVRIKPDKPRTCRKIGKPAKYESPIGLPNRAYIPPKTGPALGDPAKALIITEGEKKALKSDQEGFLCIGLVGVDGAHMKRKSKDDKQELIPDLEAVAWKGRVVYLCYDSDLADKEGVARAEWRLAETLMRKGAKVLVVRLPGGPDGAKVGLDDYLVANGPENFRRVLEAAQPAKKPKDSRPEVVIGPLEYLSIGEAIAALAKCDRTLFQRSGKLVRIVRPVRPAESKRLRGSGRPVIDLLPIADLRTRITRAAQVLKITSEKNETKKELTHPPHWLVSGVDAAADWPGVRPLEAVVTAPVLLPDGRILQEPGYSHEIGVLYEPDGDFPAVPEKPTRADAERAAIDLLEIVEDFPFARPEHKGSYVASILTPLARFAFDGPAPLFLADGNIRGLGKGLLMDTSAGVTTGRDFARAAYVPDAVEMRKTITAIALSGEQQVLFDNVAGAFGDSSLDNALTATEWQDRILGTSNRPRLPLLVTWYATGNNLVLVGDLSRRVCHVRLESKEEKPEERSGFRHPYLLKWVAQERGRLLAAALTILSAYIHAGRPTFPLKPWGSFEGWSALVRPAVVFAGLADPGLTREILDKRSDRDAATLRGLIAGWLEIDPLRQGKTITEAMKLLEDPEKTGDYPTLRAVLAETFDAEPGKPPSRKLGYALRKFARRNIGGQCFDSRDTHGGVQAWLVRKIGPDNGGDGGDGGDVQVIRTREEGKGPESNNRPPGENIPSIVTIPTNPDAEIEEGEL